MDAAYREGWSGHPEALLPTIARLNGLPVETMRALGRRLFGREIVTKRSFRMRDATPEPGAGTKPRPGVPSHPPGGAPAFGALRSRTAAGIRQRALGACPACCRGCSAVRCLASGPGFLYHPAGSEAAGAMLPGAPASRG